MSKETFRQEFVKCGKQGCKSCPHGPYWYAYRKVNGKLRKRYVGKTRPDEAKPTPARPMPTTLHEALAILGISASVNKAESRSAHRKACLANHPDRGGDKVDMQRVDAAWEILRTYERWK